MSRNAVTMCNKKESVGLFFIARNAVTMCNKKEPSGLFFICFCPQNTVISETRVSSE